MYFIFEIVIAAVFRAFAALTGFLTRRTGATSVEIRPVLTPPCHYSEGRFGDLAQTVKRSLA